MILIKNQFDIIYNDIDLKFRQNVKKPEKIIIVNKFFIDFDDCKYI